MEDLQAKGKDLIKKLQSSFKPTKFQGQGRKLGSSEASSSNTPQGVPNRFQERPLGNTKAAPNTNFEHRNVGQRALSRAATAEKKKIVPETPVGRNTEEDAGYDNRNKSMNVPTETEVEDAVAFYFSAGPLPSSVEILKKIFGNIIGDPTVEKFRKIRLANPKISEAVGEATGGIELLQVVGFELETDESNKELFAIIREATQKHLTNLKKALTLIESYSGPPSSSSNSVRLIPKKRDRQVRIFLPAEENLARRIEVPDSFYELTPSEAKALVAAGKKTLEKSKELTTRSWKERQNSGNKRRCRVAILRIQFPDMMILEGQFFPSEPTSSIYEVFLSFLAV